MADQTYTDIFNTQIKHLFQKALALVFKKPHKLWSFAGMLFRQYQAILIRQGWKKKGLLVPPVLIASVTRQCNLRCSGCYVRHWPQPTTDALDQKTYQRILGEARQLGISIVILAGGEPLLRPELLTLTRHFPQLTFCLFSNGTLMDSRRIRELKKQPHVIPVLSLEGQAAKTDRRRGSGIYHHLKQTMADLKQADIFWGISFTSHRANLAEITDVLFIQELLRQGCQLFFFIEYVPIQARTRHLVLKKAELKHLYTQVDKFNTALPGLFIAIPGDESAFGGCLSAGRGFIHLSPEGNLEPCPFSSFADSNLQNMPLSKALQSAFLHQLRQHHQRLSEIQGGCALLNQQQWVASLLRK